MRRLVVLLGALVVPLLPAAPAVAATTTYCVGTTGSCTVKATISAALTAAASDGTDSVVLIGPGSYVEPPLTADGDGDSSLTVTGAGQGMTNLTPAAGGPQTYLWVNHATVQGLTLTMPAATSDNDHGITAYNGATLDHVTVDGTGTANTTGVLLEQSSSLSHAVVDMTVGDGTRAVYVEQGPNTVSDAVLNGSEGVAQSNPNETDTISRVTIHASSSGVATDGGTVVIDDAVIDLGSSFGARGLRAENGNMNTTPKTITADHVTIVGGGSNSVGVASVAANPSSVQTSTVNLSNSIVKGPETSLLAYASTGPAGSTATVNASYSDYESTSAVPGPNGTAVVNLPPGNVEDVDPAFVSTTDFHLTPTSPLVDHGNPAAGPPAQDLEGKTRVVDGDGNGSAIRDMGAYEVQDTTAPETTIGSGPSGLTNDATPTFAFSSEAGATFQCKVDAAAYAACTSPFTTATLTNGTHTFAVRAVDGASNPDATPASRAFTVDTVAPETTITKKPAKRVTRKKAKIVFSASESGSTFQCQVDGKAWKTCTSPFKVRLKLGKHTILVRATDAAGNVEATPAKVKVRRVPVTPPSGCTGEC